MRDGSRLDHCRKITVNIASYIHSYAVPNSFKSLLAILLKDARYLWQRRCLHGKGLVSVLATYRTTNKYECCSEDAPASHKSRCSVVAP